jgi:hypothetical protein
MTLETQDLYVALSVIIPYSILSFLSYRFFVKLFQNNKKIVYLFTGATLSFYISFIYPFMYINIYVGIVIFWTLVIMFAVYSISGVLKNKKKSKKKIDLHNLTNFVILLLSIILVMFWDSFNNISHNFPDVYYNYLWIKENSNIGTVAYFPGLSIIAAMPTYTIDPFYSLNFFGASLGLIFILFINLTLKSILSFRGLIIFNLVLISPFYYALTYTRIGLNNSQIFSVLFFLIVVIFSLEWKNYRKFLYALLFIVVLSALVTAPHILFLTTPGIFIAMLITFRDKIKLIISLIIGILSIIFSALFASPDTIYSSKGFGAINLNTQNQILLLLSEILRIKYPIRNPLESIYSLSSYLILIIAFVVAIICHRKKLRTIQFVAILTVTYGITLNTGIGEFAMLKGRIGWYFMYSTALLISLIFDELIRKDDQFEKILNSNKLITIILSLNILFVLVNPPNAYRYVNENSLIEFENILKSDERSNISVYSDIEDLIFVSEKIVVSTSQEMSKESLDYVVLNLKSTIKDLTLANARDYEDRDFKRFRNDQNTQIKKRIEENRNLIYLLLNSGFSIISEKEDFIILRSPNK